MKHLARLLSRTLLALITILAAGVGTTAVMAAQEGILVGRIAYIDGKLFRYVEEEKDWVLTVNDAPFGLEDALYSSEMTQAEIIMPNRTWIRIGESTQLQLIALKPDATTMDVASGLARIYNKNRDAIIKVTTPFGYVVAPGGTVFDLYVGDDSLEVIAIEGDVDFVHEGNNARYSLREGAASIIADKWQITRGNGTVDRDWDDWNGERDNLWAQRLRARGISSDLLPEPIREDAYVLEEHGRWERVHYEGAYRDMWRPLRVEPGWRPFTVGRWSVYYGDNCWIPSEPFGYVTHHYGSWVYLDSFRAWYWSPPVVRVVPTTPSVFIGFGWYPGRVGWFHSGPSIGWVPLAPHEPYYGYRPWGQHTVIVHQTTIATVNISQYRYLDEAVVIHRDHFYRGNRYTPFIERNVNKTVIVNNYRPTTVINNTVINNYNIDRSRYTLTDERINRKPHTTVINRITENQQGVGKADRLNRGGILQDLTQITAASEPPAAAKIRAPMVTTKVVQADNVAKPLENDGPFQKAIKPKERERRIADGDTLLLEVPGQQPAAVQAPIDRNERRHMQAAREARNELMSGSKAAAGITAQPTLPVTPLERRPPGFGGGEGHADQGTATEKQPGKRPPQSLQEERRTKEQATAQPALPVTPLERRPPGFGGGEGYADQGPVDQGAAAEKQLGKRPPRASQEERRTKEQATAQPTLPVTPLERRPPGFGGGEGHADQGHADQSVVAEEQKVQQRREQDAQRRQQEQVQQRQAQEAQRLQQKQEKQRQEQDVHRRQLEQEQQGQTQEVQRRQLEKEQQRQAQEVQRLQQKQELQRREQEVQRRQQEQKRQEQEMQRRQQEKEVQQRQPQEAQPQEAQQMKKKKKGLTQEELDLLLRQQQAPK
jgi:hypothetical protein